MENKILKCIISYDGSKFYGLQIQKNKKTIIGEIYKALNKLNITTHITHAGRTDRGVHALNQVIAFEVPDFWQLERLQYSLNKILYPSIFVKKITKTDKDFHARFSAVKRSYRYLITQHFSPFNAKYSLYYPKEIDLNKINNALNILKGKHDFEYFAKTGSDVNHYVREIFEAYAYKYKNFYVIKLKGNGFLRGQIRIIVHFLLQINENRLSIEDLKKQLNKEKLIIKRTISPNGLYFERIWY